MTLLVLLFYYFAACCFVSYAARQRGRAAEMWFFAAVVFSPLVAGLGLGLCPSRISPEMIYKAKAEARST